MFKSINASYCLGATEIQLESGSKGNHVIYSPELDILVHAHHIGVAAIYDFKTKQKIGPDPCGTYKRPSLTVSY